MAQTPDEKTMNGYEFFNGLLIFWVAVECGVKKGGVILRAQVVS